MPEEKINPKVGAFLRTAKKWREEMARLRTIVRDLRLTEEFKWGHPCYTFQNSNVVLIHAFKEYCALLFFKGVLLKDARGILIQQTENVQSARQIRFTSVREVVEKASVLRAYIKEAVEVEKAGLKVVFKRTTEYAVPAEFGRKLREIPALKAAFAALTPGRQRGYLFYFSAPKQSKTREARIEKCKQRIFRGRGLDD